MTYARLTLTARLTVWFTVVTTAVLLGLGILVAWATARHFVELDKIHLDDKIHLVAKLVSESANPAELTDRLDELLESHNGLFIQLWLDGDLVYGPEDLTANDPSVLLAPQEIIREWRYAGRALRGFTENLHVPPAPPRSDAPPRDMRVLAAVDTGHHAHFLGSMRKTLVIYLLAAAVVCGVLGWWVARRGLAPLKTMRERATSITAHNLQQRMPVESVPIELAELATSLNGMLDRLKQDFQRLMDFSGDLAHELRTPMSNLLTQTQVALAQRRSPDEYREVLASNAEEYERLARMVSDMLFLAKTENGIDLPHRERIQLQDEVLALFDFYEAVAEERSIRLVTQGQAEMNGDRLMIRRAISNLLSNALRHANTGTAVVVDMAPNNGSVGLKITNEGPTIAPEDALRLFDRFYRADKSRSHPASEGAGLGLAITKAIVESHGGQIGVRSSDGRTSFMIAF